MATAPTPGRTGSSGARNYNNQAQAGYQYAPGAVDPNYYQTRQSGSQAPVPGSQPQTDPTGTNSNTETGETPEQQAERLRRANQAAIIRAQFDALGLGDLAGQITSWLQEGYDADAMMALVRTTQQYKDRFPAMAALQAKGKSITEQQYMDYEQAMGQYERLFGLPQGMLSSKDQVTKNLTNELSVREVEERATKASASIYQLPQEFRQTMQDYYNVDSGGLAAYFLDPDIAAPLLEKQYVAGQIGMEARLRSVGVDKTLAEALQERGVSREQAATGFQTVAGMGGLAVGKGDTASQQQAIGATFGTDPNSQQAVERAAKSRVNRFEAGGSFAQDKSGVSGLGSAAT